MSAMEVISCPADLQYVNKKLAMCLDSQVWMRTRAISREVDPDGIPVEDKLSFCSRTFPSHIKNSDLTVTFSQVASDIDFDRHFLSPDSTVQCDDPECPIKVPQNKGRFYADEHKANSPTDFDFETSSGGSMVPASHYFNYTVPPPEITDA